MNTCINTFFLSFLTIFLSPRPQAKSEDGIASQVWAAGDNLIREGLLPSPHPHHSLGGVSGEHSRAGLPLVKTPCSLPFCSWPGGWEQGEWSVSFSRDASKTFCRPSATLIWVTIKVWEPSYSVNLFIRCWKKKTKKTPKNPLFFKWPKLLSESF